MRDYGNMTMKQLVECIIEEAKRAGTINYPLRTSGYHESSNLTYTDRLLK